MSIQKNIFLEKEADSWFDRNLSALTQYSIEKDPVARELLRYVPISESLNILEIGCSSGHRLQALKNKIPHLQLYGIEPSKKAVGYCKMYHKNVIITEGTAEDLSVFATAFFDVIIIGFVFYVLDRDLLFRSISEIDRVLKQKGHVIIIDFFSVKPHKNPYHHIKEQTMFSYKQDYAEIFTASRLYHLISRSSHHHTTLAEDGSNDFYNKISVSTLIKEYESAY
jgi:Methylase involved in ubiquinone/menaquinone biosynthesis